MKTFRLWLSFLMCSSWCDLLSVRSEGRYCYTREVDGFQQYEYPAVDTTDMDISTTPPHEPKVSDKPPTYKYTHLVCTLKLYNDFPNFLNKHWQIFLDLNSLISKVWILPYIFFCKDNSFDKFHSAVLILGASRILFGIKN